jgi:hypothetical protein
MRPGTPLVGAVAWALLIGVGAASPAMARPALDLAARCGTAKAAQLRPWPEAPVSPSVPTSARAKDGHLLERDAFGALPNVVFSEHFAIKWGPDLELDDSVAEAAAAVLEEALAVQTGALGFPPPTGNDLFFFNVYVGDSGDPAPPSLGVAGYFAHDDDGQPYLVFSPAALDDDVLPSVAAHELLHALQAAGGRFAYTAETAWLAEATAEWAIAPVFADDPYVGSLGFGMTLAPHLALHHYEPFADSAGVGPYHPYGAFLFFQHAVDVGVPATFVADIWTDQTPGGTTLDVLDRVLAANGRNIAELTPTMALANATYTYAFGEQLATFDDEAEALFGSAAARVALSVSEVRRGQWSRVALEMAPQPGGYSVISLSAGAGLDERVIRFDGDTVGEDGGRGIWRVWLLEEGAAPAALELDDAHEARVRLDGSGTLRLVAALTSDQSLPFERFSYRVLDGVPGEGDDGETERAGPDGGTAPPLPGCACVVSSAAGGPALGGLCLVGAWWVSVGRRGRRRACAR